MVFGFQFSILLLVLEWESKGEYGNINETGIYEISNIHSKHHIFRILQVIKILIVK